MRQGKFFEIEIAAPAAGEAPALAAEMAHRLLANPVIESYRVEVVTSRASAPSTGASGVCAGTNRSMARFCGADSWGSATWNGADSSRVRWAPNGAVRRRFAGRPRWARQAQALRGERADMKVAVAVFPGSNCDHDAYHALKHVIGCDVAFVWHKAADLGGADAVVLPGGFSYGDYLRSGAIARFSPIMTRVAEFAAAGGPVLGICNGFQVLLEAGLLPGGMRRNRGLRFLCEQVHLRVERTDTPFTGRARAGQVLQMPIAHGEGETTTPPRPAWSSSRPRAGSCSATRRRTAAWTSAGT